MDLYACPDYYEIAFSFRDISAEVDVLEACIRRHSLIPVESVLELGCGNAPHRAELSRRGYRYTGLDLSPTMVGYGRRKALGTKAVFVQGDMARFSLGACVDFAFVALGSLYVRTLADLASHFASVAAALRPGGLYFLDWPVTTSLSEALKESWTIERDGVQVQVKVSHEDVDRQAQTYVERIELLVDDHGREIQVSSRIPRRAFFPGEFRRIVAEREDFEFVGWWNNWDLNQPFEKAERVNRPIVLVRRRGAG